MPHRRRIACYPPARLPLRALAVGHQARAMGVERGMLHAADKVFIEYYYSVVEALLVVQHGLRHSLLETRSFRMDSKPLPLSPGY